MACLLPEKCSPSAVKFERKPSVLIFTDGAFEPDEKFVASMGAVMFDTASGHSEFFEEQIASTLVRQWQADGTENVIAQAELLPVVVSRHLWSSTINDSRCFFMIDNDGVRAALINSSSSSLMNRFLLTKIAEQEQELTSFPWYARVPSASNLADAPSRLSFDFLLSMGSKRVRVSESLTLDLASASQWAVQNE